MSTVPCDRPDEDAVSPSTGAVATLSPTDDGQRPHDLAELCVRTRNAEQLLQSAIMPRFADFDASSLRRTNSVEGGFPWKGPTITLLRVDAKGIVTQATRVTEKRTMLTQAGTKDLLAARPGKWSQDIFLVDDLKAAMEALG